MTLSNADPGDEGKLKILKARVTYKVGATKSNTMSWVREYEMAAPIRPLDLLKDCGDIAFYNPDKFTVTVEVTEAS